MSFIRALFSGVSGIRGHQTMMDVIGNNIANINTIGFKTGRATFSETFAQTLSSATAPPNEAASGARLLRGGTNPLQVGLGSNIGSIDNIFSQGSLQNSGLPTDIAIEGPGLFAVRLADSVYYTRAGNFVVDGDGRLINPSTGGFLLGRLANQFGTFPAGSDTVPGADQLDDLQINLGQKAAAYATRTVTFFGNLDHNTTPADTDVDEGGSPITVTTPVYDSLGTKWNLTITFTKDTEPADGTPQTWLYTVQTATRENPANVDEGGIDTISIEFEGELTFNPDGSILDDGGAGEPVLVEDVEFSAFGALDQTITLFFGTPSIDDIAPEDGIYGQYDGVTGFANQNSIAVRKQDGYTSGLLEDFFIDQNGKITGKFTNGTTQTLGQVMLANFDNVAGLSKIGSNLFAESGNSGSPVFSEAGKQTSSRIRGGSLEQSNVDLAEEFSNLILAQRGFQANAKVVNASDELIQELLNLRR